MFGLNITLSGDLDVDHWEFEFECPKCKFLNDVWIKQVRTRDVIICRGCKVNIKLDDQMDSFRKTKQSIARKFKELQKSIDRINRGTF